MLSGVESVLGYFDDCKVKHWKIYYDNNKSGGTPILSSPEDEEISIEESRERLKRALERLLPGNYKIDCKQLWKQSTHFNSIRFNITSADGRNQPAIAGMQGPHINAYNPDYVPVSDIDKHVKKLLEQERMKTRIAELEAQIKEAEDNSIGKFLNAWGPAFMPAIAAKLGVAQTAVGVAGFGKQQQQAKTEQPTTTVQTESEETDFDARITAVLQELIILEGDEEKATVLLEKLILFAKQNKAMYESIKPTILATQKI
mgnify:CR=1 FL=1